MPSAVTRTGALTRAQQRLVDARIALHGTIATQLFGEHLVHARRDAMQASRLLRQAARQGGSMFPAEYASAAALARQAAVAIGRVLVTMRQHPGELTGAERDEYTRRLNAAAEVLGMSFIGAYTGTHY